MGYTLTEQETYEAVRSIEFTSEGNKYEDKIRGKTDVIVDTTFCVTQDVFFDEGLDAATVKPVITAGDTSFYLDETALDNIVAYARDRQSSRKTSRQSSRKDFKLASVPAGNIMEELDACRRNASRRKASNRSRQNPRSHRRYR